MSTSRRRASNEFLRVPKPVREMRGVSWTAKALAAHLAFRQGSRATVAYGLRRLAAELGVARNTALRAVHEAAGAGLLRVTAAGNGRRASYDARAATQGETVAESATVGRSKGCDTTVPETATLPSQGLRRTVPESATRKESVKKVKQEREKARAALPACGATPKNDHQLVALYAKQHASLTNRARSQFVQAVAEARAAGATDALIAHAISRNGEGPPWSGPNAARDEARAVVQAWAREDLGGERLTVAAILADLDHAREYVERKNLATYDAGLDRNRRALRWANKHRQALGRASRWPEGAGA